MKLIKPILLPLFLLVAAVATLNLNRFSFEAADSNGFVVDNALATLKEISRKPHPMGSVESARIRAFLLAQLNDAGLTTEVQSTEVVRGNTVASVANIIARLPGKNPDNKALLLMSHYDSVANSFGANDAGYGVATIVETVRALSQQGPFENDIIVVISDGEEKGLYGARAFVDEHPLAKNIGLVLNFESRGSSGPVLLFETSGNNAGLIRDFSAKVTTPIGDSLWSAIYNMMPNQTDMALFDDGNISTLNFAYIDGKYNYHSSGDNFNNVSRQSVAHAGDYAINLARHFANTPLPVAAGSDAVFFNLFGTVFISYASAISYVLGLLAIVLFVLLVRGQAVRGGALASGTFIVLLQWIFSAAVASFLIQTLNFNIGLSHYLRGAAEDWLFAALLLMALAIQTVWVVAAKAKSVARFAIGGAVLYAVLAVLAGYDIVTVAIVCVVVGSGLFFMAKKAPETDQIHLHHLCAWLILVVLSCALAPQIAHIFTLPLLFFLAIEWLRQNKASGNEALLMVAASVAGVMWLHYVYQFNIAIGDMAPGLIVLCVMMVLGLVWPMIKQHVDLTKGLVVPVYVIAAIALYASPVFVNPFSKDTPKPNEVFYWQDNANDKAYFASSQWQLDSWSRELLTKDTTVKQKNPLNIGTRGSLWLNPTIAADIDSAKLTVVNDGQWQNGREVMMKLTSNFPSEETIIQIENPDNIESVSFNGHPLKLNRKRKGYLVLKYLAMPTEGIDILVKSKNVEPLNIKVLELRNSWPSHIEFMIPQRQPDTMPKPYTFSDSTVISNKFRL